MRWFVLLVAVACAKHAVAPRVSVDAGTTDEDCARAMDRMKQVIPDLATDDAEKASCKKLPRPVVLCLQRVNSQAEADDCIRRYAQAGAGFQPVRSDERPEPIGKESAPSASDCRRAIDHVKQVVPGFQADADLLAHCLRTATADDVACLLGAKNVDDVRHCGFSED